MIEMPFYSIEVKEANSETAYIPYQHWYPEIDDNLWQRLEVPGQARNGTYRNPSEFKRRELYDRRGDRSVSHFDRLDYWRKKLAIVFCVEDYLYRTKLGGSKPKILEIGSWPSRTPLISTQYENSVIGILSQDRNKIVVGVDDIDMETAFPYRSRTFPHFGEATFLNENFVLEKTRKELTKVLRGKPDVIIGNWVFEKRVGNSARYARAVGLGNILAKNMAESSSDDIETAERLAYEANEFLGDSGVVILSNWQGGSVPEFIHDMPLLAVYGDEKGSDVFAQVRGKLK